VSLIARCGLVKINVPNSIELLLRHNDIDDAAAI
jgi:hypothetical protein